MTRVEARAIAPSASRARIKWALSRPDGATRLAAYQARKTATTRKWKFSKTFSALNSLEKELR